MTKATQTDFNYVWVKDRKCNEFICNVKDLKDPQKATQDELKNCIDDAKSGIALGD